ncbi:hypothetical protein U1Q18_009461 [Sarracenia purpurea var. burkii]
MDPKSRRLASTLPVPNVQELAQEPLKEIPPRYVRSDQDHPIICDTASLPQLPIINLQNLLGGNDDVNSELQKLHLACKDWGFFQLINHGVSSSLVEKVKVDIHKFFKLPLEEKKKLYQESGDVEGYGQIFIVSEDQKLDWADVLYFFTLPVHQRKPHLLPKLPLPLRDTIEAYSTEMKDLSMKILDRVEKALKVKDGEMIELFEDEGLQSMRMNYYPPCPQPEHAIGLSTHSDGSGITILLQLNEIEGLQIKKDRRWIPITPLPGAFIVNIGDLLEIMTNGIYKSIEHRATVNSKKERISIATFVSPRIDGPLGPASSLITPDNPALFKTTTVADFYRGFLSRELRGKSFVEGLRIRSEAEKDN